MQVFFQNIFKGIKTVKRAIKHSTPIFRKTEWRHPNSFLSWSCKISAIHLQVFGYYIAIFFAIILQVFCDTDLKAFSHHYPTSFQPLSYKFSAILLQVFCHSPTSFLSFSYNFSAILLQVFCHPPTSFLPFSYKFSAILLQVFCHPPTSFLPLCYMFSITILQVFCHYLASFRVPTDKPRKISMIF